jgi:hypothetical protein
VAKQSSAIKIGSQLQFGNQKNMGLFTLSLLDTSEWFKKPANAFRIIKHNIFHELWETNETMSALILSIALILSVALYCFCTRYKIVPTGEKDLGISFKIDRITGKTWVCAGNTFTPVVEKK